MLVRWHLSKPGTWLAVAVPAALAAALIGGLACLLLFMSAREADTLVIKRDRSLAASILQQAVERIAHDQESVTAWDEAVIHLHEPFNPDWIDDNIGLWMNMYFGHERIVVLDPADRPIYVSIGDKRVGPDAYETLKPLVRPMLADVRRMLASGHWNSPDQSTRSPGAEDVVVVDGHPAVLSVKPVVPSTAKVQQSAADAFAHVAVHYLDGSFLTDLKQRYLFDNARFSWVDAPQTGEQSFAFRNKQGQAIGFLLWKMNLPGQVLLSRMVPALVGTLCLILTVVAVLVARLRQGARALKASEARARHLAFSDVLTGLPNRACFNERLAEACARSSDGDPILMLLDLDRFKQVNDTLGHPAGDELIRQVGARLDVLAPPGATVARIGGDEFVILLTGIAPRDAVRLCESVVTAISAPFLLNADRVEIGVSIGVASARGACTPESLVRQSDEALYKAKKRGGGTVFADEVILPIPSGQAIAA